MCVPDPEPEPDPEPMLGHGFFDVPPFGVVDFVEFGAGALGVVVFGVVVFGVVLGVVLVVAADAPAMPAAAPPVASAPATIVALSMFDMCIGSDLLGWGRSLMLTSWAATLNEPMRNA